MSLTPASRVSAEIEMSPKNPPRPMISPAATPSTRLIGVRNGASTAASATVTKSPVIRPSHVLLGLIAGTTLCRPKSLPATYCTTSENCVRKTR